MRTNSPELISCRSPKLDPVFMKHYFYYVINRHKIQMKKDAGLPYPWTNDKILRDNSFTCNRRVDDRTTKWLLNHISNNSSLSLGDRFWRTIIFRLYNKIETAELIELDSPNFWNNIEHYADLLDQQTCDVYTRAYKTVSLKYVYRDKYSNRNWRSWTLLGIRDLAKSLVTMSIPYECLTSAIGTFNYIKSLPGVGDFIGLQIFIDLSYMNETPYTNNDFVIAGPGARTGLDRMFIDKAGMTYEECIRYLAENFEDLCREYYDPTFKYRDIKNELSDNNAYCVCDIQNTLCEASKYFYLLEDKHKNKRKYIPSNKEI